MNRNRYAIPNGFTTANMLDDCRICEQPADEHTDPYFPERDHDGLDDFLYDFENGMPMADVIDIEDRNLATDDAFTF